MISVILFVYSNQEDTSIIFCYCNIKSVGMVISFCVYRLYLLIKNQNEVMWVYLCIWCAAFDLFMTFLFLFIRLKTVRVLTCLIYEVTVKKKYIEKPLWCELIYNKVCSHRIPAFWVFRHEFCLFVFFR